MTLAVRDLDDHTLMAHLAQRLNCHDARAAVRTALIAEHIRMLVWAPFVADPPAQPIHTARLLGALARNVRFLAAAADLENLSGLHDLFAFVRDQLVRCGDIHHAGDGNWLPCPVRLVRVSRELIYVFGGAPLHALSRHIHVPIVTSGTSRHLQTPDAGLLPVDALDTWLEQQEPLPTWTEQILAWAATELLPQADIEDDSLEIYAPDLHRALKRSGFWIGVREFREVSPTLRLFRPKVAQQWTFNRPDYVGVFAPGPHGAQLVKAVRIPHNMARRLQFGFDLKYRTPRRVVLRRLGHVYRLDTTYPPFPDPEARVLGLGWCEPGQADALFFAASALAVLRGVTDRLGMQLYHA